MYIGIQELKEIASIMEGRLHVDFQDYNQSFLHRRVAYMFDKMGFRRIQDLKDAMASLVTADEVSYYMSVPSTELFRDAPFWRQLRQTIADHRPRTYWLPCLTSYHELFSLLILLDREGAKGSTVEANVLSDHIARDIRTMRLSLKEESTDRQNFERLQAGFTYDDYVTRVDGAAFLKDGMLRSVQITNGWLLNAPPRKYDVVIFRNMLLGYGRSLHKTVVTRLADSLADTDALLCVGVGEQLLVENRAFDDSRIAEGIYRLKKTKEVRDE